MDHQQQIEKWIEQMRNHDEDAFREFYEEWYPKVYYIALAITHHDADAKDAAQETMIEVHRSIDKLRDVNYFKLWLNRIVISKCNRIFRKRKAITMDMEQHEALMMQEEERDEFLPSDHMHRQSDVEVLTSLLMKISPIYAQVLVLMYYEQLSIKEIAEVLQVPEGTVKSRLNSAKLKLKAEIANYEQQENVKLSFHEESLGALLVLAYQQLAKRTVTPITPSISRTRSHRSFSFSKAALAGTTAVAMGIVGVKLVMDRPQDSSRADSVDVSKKPSTFSSMVFRDIPIESEKDAYFVLMRYAHCDVEINQLDEQEKAVMNELQRRLDHEGSIYYQLWQKRSK